MGEFKKDKRKKILINPTFQLRFLAGIVGLNILVCATFYIGQFYYFWQMSQLGQQLALPPDHVFFRFVGELSRHMTYLYCGTASVVSILIFFFGMYYSHRIAGPLHHLKKYLIAKANGQSKGILKFRDNDYFHDVADAVNHYTESQDKKSMRHRRAA